MSPMTLGLPATLVLSALVGALVSSGISIFVELFKKYRLVAIFAVLAISPIALFLCSFWQFEQQFPISADPLAVAAGASTGAVATFAYLFAKIGIGKVADATSHEQKSR